MSAITRESESAAAASSPTASLDPRSSPVYELYRRLRNVALSAQRPGDAESLVAGLVHELVGAGGSAPAAFLGGRLYRRVDDAFELVVTAGEAGSRLIGDRVPAAHPVIQRVLAQGWLLLEYGDPLLDAEMRTAVGDRAVAIIALGPGGERILSFSLAEPLAPEELVLALATLRSIADTGLRQRELHSLLEQARDVQTSLLPRDLEAPPGYELAVRARPAEIVGGDVFDLLRISPGAFGVCIADATGHGLPAALQARDAIIGLRMGVEQSLKVVATLEKLDRVIARSSSAATFISLFYVELDDEGHLIYVNAGHPPPLLLRADGRCERLVTGGPVLGLELSLSRRYSRGFAQLADGDLLALYTDGITEVTSPGGEELGIEGLLRLLRRHQDRPIELLADLTLAEVDRFAGGGRWIDDQTLLVLRRRSP